MKKLLLKSEKSILLITLLVVTSISRGQSTQTYSSDGSFLTPSGVTSIIVEAWGAGGGAGANSNAQGGGGGGAYTKGTITSIPSNTTYTVDVGTGGTIGNAGGPSFVSSINANGGAGASNRTGGAGGAASTITGFVTNSYKGGDGGNGRVATGGGNNEAGGGGGGSAFNNLAGNNGTTGANSTSVATAGGTGTGNGGFGAAADGNPVSTTGQFPGGGGGGRGEGGATSQPGADGRVIITYTCPTYALTASTLSNGPLCGASAATITLRSSSLASGTYTVTYTLSGVAGTSTATMNFTAGSPGTGTFTTSSLNVGTTTVTITNLTSSYCTNAISSNNTVNVVVNPIPTAVAGTNINTCSTSGAVNITAGSSATNATSVTWSGGSGTFSAANSLTLCTYTPSAAENLAGGSITLTLTVTGLAPCATVVSTKTLTISRVMTAVAGTAITTCSNSGAVNITGGSSATNYVSIAWSSNGTGTFVNSGSLTTCTYNPSAADIAAGSRTLTLTASNAGCSAVLSTKTITISQAPTAVAGTDINICSTSGAVNITAGSSATNATSVTWSGGSGTFSAANSLTLCTYTPSAAENLAGGSITLTLTVTGLAPCATVVSTKTLTISRAMTAVAGTAITTCSNSGAVNITGGSSATNYVSIAWSSNGTGTFVNSGSLTTCTYNPSAADIAAGSRTLTLTASNAGCSAVISTKTITISQAPTAVAGTAINICSPSGAVNITAGSSATTATSVTWSGGGGTFSGANSLTLCTYTPSITENLLGGTITLSLTATGIAPCATVVSTKTLTINRPMIAIAGTNVTTCSTTGAVNITSGSSATNHVTTTWTSSGTGTFANATSLTLCTYTPSVADIAAGSVTLTLTASNGGCADVTSTKTLTITTAATSNAGTVINTCSTTGAVNITAGSSATNYSSIAWTSNGSGTFTNANSLTLCTYTPSAADITAGTRTLTLTAFGNSPCGNVVSTKNIIISKAMTAVAGTAITTCSTSGAVNITAGSSATNHVTATWTSSGTGTLANATSLTLCTYTPSVADITAGSVTLTLTASNAGCANVISTKTLTIYTLPTAVAGAAMTTCTAYGAVNITGGSSATNQTSVAWTSSGTGTFANATSLTTCTYAPSAADITAGSVTLTLTAFGNSPCGNAISTKTLNITTSVSVTGTTPGSRTGAGTVLLGATSSGGTLNWYSVPTGGTSIGSGTSFTTPSITMTTTFYVEAITGICASTPRTAVIATVNYPEIDIQGNATSIPSGDITPTTTDWTDFGSANVTRTFTIRNTGGALLTLGSITISGTNASEFTVTTAPSSVVGVGASTTFVVTFAPTATGVRTANISIDNNDMDENPYTFDIRGTGIDQEIDIQGNAVSIVNGDTTPSTTDWTDFSNVAGTRTFTIRNLGNIALNVGTITIGGANASDFTVTTPPNATVAAFGTTTFTVAFSPSAINARVANISIVNNDSNENPYTYAVQGFGIIPEIDIQGNGVSIADNLVPAPSTTNWTDFGSAASTRTFTVYNNGNIALTLGAITFTGANPTEFTVTTAPSSSVAAFSSTTFVVTFAPTAIGLRTANISIVNNDNNENPYDFRIQGTGVAREIDLQGSALSIASGDMVTSVSDGTDFGAADINLATVTRTFTILNTGSLALTISNPTITGANASEFTVTANPGTLSIGAGSSTTFQVTFNPSAVFTRSAQINIVNNDSDENPYFFAIQGTGLLDNDGDGIENNADQDDDNDGIIDTVECGTCISDPFVNGSFETPAIGTATYAILPTSSVTGWQTSAENFIEIWSTGMDGGYGPVPSAAGNQFAELNANIAGTLYQTFCLNGAGGTINWAIKHRGRAGSDTAYVRFGPDLASAVASVPIATMVDGNSSWGSYSGTYSIPVGQTNIVLAFIAGSTASGDASVGNLIDDVQIIINQNCIDSDGDGIADLLDVDDDNDGIPDIEEAGFKAYSNNTGTMDKTNPANWKDVNTNGINDYIDSMISAGTYTIPDADGDGVKNHLDLDSDNDTLFDVDEAGLLNGDGDITGDGKGDSTDSEGDGLLNLYDNSTNFGSAFRAYAQDSDANGISDYLQLDANDDGIDDIQTGLYASFDANGDGKIDGTGDADGDGITDTFDTNDTTKGSPRDLNRKLYLDFDGRNDYAEDSAVLGGLSGATLMAWIDLNGSFNTTGVVVGQDKFQIRISNSRKFAAVVNGTTVLFNTALNKSQWYHVAATYGGGSLNMYLNGKLVATQAVTGNIAADATKLTLGRDPIVSTTPLATPYYFKGKIDEVRVFNTALTASQVERMVYQEIQDNASQVRGAIVPKDIGSLPFTNVLKYYRMDAYKDDIVDNLTTASIDTGTGMKLYNHKVIAVQQAPMPFTTLRTGTFATAVNDPTKDIRGLDVLDYDSSIIQVKHNITETANSTDLAMFVDPGVTINMTNDTKIQNDWYLKLDGKIDLVGKSQLVQSTNSELDVTSAGSLERDQQGQSNKFNYNYWSSPVSSINSTTINHGFTVAGVMKDGTNVSSPQNLQWTTGINGSPTSPITLSSYWIFKFQNSSNTYANWASVGQNGTLLAGQGYTMKGCGSATADQNYTFVGKPNNGTITSTVGANNLNLCGNPYPSAIDADKFIDDNAASIKGTLYIWQHYSTNTSHTTIQYQGGYATYTKTGGTAPGVVAGTSGLGSSSKVAKRFIPVGQGFFVTGTPAGGTITFNNSQRQFFKEDDATSYTMFKSNNNTVSSDPEMNNASDSFIDEQFMKVRVGFNATDNYHRQTLLGFMNEHATAEFDDGYDGLSIETLPSDMYFINGTNKLNINGEGYFNVDKTYPLGVKNATSGNVTFVIDNKENFDENQEIYIFDNVTNTYNSIKSQSYQVNLPAGTYDNRFMLTFKNGTLGTVDHEENHGIAVTHSQSNNMINIKNELQEVTVKSVLLFNLLGQQITDWNMDDQNQADIHLPVSDLSTGTYIVKVITDGGDITKKILIQK